MDQEECPSEQSERKLFTRSAARHLRRKLLNNARKIEKQLAPLANGLTDSTPKISSETGETLSKSKARRLRKKTKLKEGENCCSVCDPCVSTNTEPPTVHRENDTQCEEAVIKSKTRRLRRRNRTVKQTENSCYYYSDTCASIIDQDSLNCPKTTDTTDTTDNATINGGNLEVGSIVDRKEEEVEKPGTRDGVGCPIDHAKNDNKEAVGLESKLQANVESLEDLSELSYSPEFPGLLKIEDESLLRLEKHTDRTRAEEEPESRVMQQSDNSFRESNIDSRVVDCPSNPEPVNESTKLNRNTTGFRFSSSQSETPETMAESKGNNSEKSREEIKAEREAKKAAKAASKARAKAAKKGQAKEETNNGCSGPVGNTALGAEAATEPKKNDESSTQPSAKSLTENRRSLTEQASKTMTEDAESGIAEKSESKEVVAKSKAALRAERRAKQEAQRAAKQQLLCDKNEKFKVKGPVVENTISMSGESPEKVNVSKKPLQKKDTHEVNLFKHLYHERELACMDVSPVNSSIHPVIVKLGAEYASKVIVGSNARCIALLAAVKQLFEDFEPPSQTGFMRSLEAKLQESEAYLHHCRPLAVSMQNALRHLKMTLLSPQLSDENAKSKLQTAIDTYIIEQIELAGKAISLTIQKKISDGDVILTYGYSTLIHKILLDAHNAEKRFRVIIADGRPWLEGKEQLKRLTHHGIECSYVLINALSYVMPEVSKVFLGAHAILANGAVMSRVGTAQVALIARAFNVPVLVACETHKSCERVQTDSIVYNELGNADDLAEDYETGTKKPLLANWRTKKSLNLLNIMYDVTPADLVTAVVTELAILPCTSVPVILRIKPSEI